MQYIKIPIDFGCRNYCEIIRQIDEAIDLLHQALINKVLDMDVAGYELNTGQTNVKVQIKTNSDIVNNIERLEKLRDQYVIMAKKSRHGSVIILKDQNNFRN